MAPGDERAPAAADLSASDQLILEYRRAGAPDAEIAVRLGISPGDVRLRADRLAAAERSVRNDDALATEVQGSAPRGLPIAAGIGVGALLVVVIAALWIDRRAAVAPANPATAPAITATVLPKFPGVAGAATVIAGETLVDSGIVFQSSRFHDLTISNRQALIAITAADDFTVRASGDPAWHVTGYGTGQLDIEGASAGRDLHVYLQAADETTRILTLLPAADAVVYSKSLTVGPTVTIFVRDDGGRTFHANLGDDGRLLVAVDPIPADAVLSEWTGERLDVSQATVVGKLTNGSGSGIAAATTSCEDGPCAAFWTGVIVPAANGVLSCASGDYLQFATGAYRLRFVDTTGGGHPAADCGAVRVGQVPPFDSSAIPASRYQLTAVDASGNAADVAVAIDGTLYVGHITHTVGCPCMHGN